MANFYVTLNNHEIAEQIAALLNLQNKLYKRHTARTIMINTTDYFVELHGNVVIGCTGLVREFPTISKSYHTSVHPDHQKKGLGTKLIKTAMANCSTPFIYGTIREDNPASLRMVQKLGWKYIRRDWSRDHFIITMATKM